MNAFFYIVVIIIACIEILHHPLSKSSIRINMDTMNVCTHRHNCPLVFQWNKGSEFQLWWSGRREFVAESQYTNSYWWVTLWIFI